MFTHCQVNNQFRCSVECFSVCVFPVVYGGVGKDLGDLVFIHIFFLQMVNNTGVRDGEKIRCFLVG
jgi:hypothetical protein